MKRVIGFALFFVALGIGISLLLPTQFSRILIMIVCLLVGYQMFCGR